MILSRKSCPLRQRSNTSQTKRHEKSAQFTKKEHLSWVTIDKYPSVESTCRSVASPKKQFDLQKRPFRGSHCVVAQSRPTKRLKLCPRMGSCSLCMLQHCRGRLMASSPMAVLSFRSCSSSLLRGWELLAGTISCSS